MVFCEVLIDCEGRYDEAFFYTGAIPFYDRVYGRDVGVVEGEFPLVQFVYGDAYMGYLGEVRP